MSTSIPNSAYTTYRQQNKAQESTIFTLSATGQLGVTWTNANGGQCIITALALECELPCLIMQLTTVDPT